MHLPRALARIYMPEQIVTSSVRLVTLPAVFMQATRSESFGSEVAPASPPGLALHP